ncbi:hypothetical protein RJ55_07700 [Drechmeria coniospora]|nr:hypothetical protein RJ55_07700 [Drechmeria coniospora]
MNEHIYTVFVRVPVPRGEFIDPPQVHWDSGKDDALWKILSEAAQTEIDWNQVAEQFDVPVDFLLQQVDFLTERHASQVRAQVRKATAAAKGPSSSPNPGERASSALSVRRDASNPLHDSGTPLAGSSRPMASRNTSAGTNAAAVKDAAGSSPRLPAGGRADGTEQRRRRLSSLSVASPTVKSPPLAAEEGSASLGPAESNSTVSSDEDESSPANSRIIRRPPRFQQQPQEVAEPYEEEDGDESEPAFQPYPSQSNQVSSAQDLASTLKGDGRPAQRGPKQPVLESQTSDSSASSVPILQRPGKSRDLKGAGPLSPRRTAELAAGGKAKANSRSGSDGTPSMGSSFSDLDDASVTQSALEEALASHMKRGASSRFSISGAFRSRYNAGSSQP